MDRDSHILAPPATPPRRPPKRSNQLVGVHFESPKRHRPWRKDTEPVIRPGLARQEQELAARLKSLLEKVNGPDRAEENVSAPQDDLCYEAAPMDDCSPTSSINDCTNGQPSQSEDEKEPRARRLLPDEATQKSYNDWLLLIPELTEEYLGYMQRAIGRLGRSSGEDTHAMCASGMCTPKRTSIQCLHFDRPSFYIFVF